MEALSTPEFWANWLRIVLIDLALAGDNAVVIALAVRTLPARSQFLGRLFGSLGAVILRIGLIFLVTSVLRLPGVRIIGGLLLIGIAVKLVRPDQSGPDRVRHGSNLKEAIGIIVMADIVMSLDNVLAIAAAAKGDVLLVTFGLALSLPLVVWGSGFLSVLMNRFPWIIWLGGGVLGFVAVDMIFQEEFVARWVLEVQPVIPRIAAIVTGAVITATGWWLARGAGHAKDANQTA